MQNLIDKLEQNHILTKPEFIELISSHSEDDFTYLRKRAQYIRHLHYGHDIYIRGLIEFTNYCKNDCYYCGIRKSNLRAERYRLTKEQIMECCHTGYSLGFRTFVLQGGEDAYFTTNRLSEIIREIKQLYPHCAITLSIGERCMEDYQIFFDAGADRFLLRHETANSCHYESLHPSNLTLENRMNCLWNLKKIGYQTGTGFMVGSPGQKPEHLAEDMLFLHQLQPEMVGIGPFLPHHDTPFSNEKGGNLKLTLFMLSLIRVMLPQVLLPSTTALGTISEDGRKQGILSGANVIMPNLSPTTVRQKYMLYDNKIATGEEAAESKSILEKSMKSIGYDIIVSRGDFKSA